MELAAQRSYVSQDHDWWLRYPPEGSPSAVGRVPLALNSAPLTWDEAGLDPNDPFLADKWTKAVIYGIQGYNPEKAMIDEAKRMGIQYGSVRG